MSTIAVFSVSAGTGHVRAAEALKATAELKFPHVKVTHIDLMTLVPPLFRKVYADSYFPLVEHHPALWGYLYERSDRRKLDSKLDQLRIALERLNTNKLIDTLREVNPDHVICTHFLPAELFSRWRRKKTFQKPVWVVLTDFDVHMLWVHRYLSGYFAANEEVAWRLRDRGVGEGSTHVTGIPHHACVWKTAIANGVCPKARRSPGKVDAAADVRRCRCWRNTQASRKTPGN